MLKLNNGKYITLIEAGILVDNSLKAAHNVSRSMSRWPVIRDTIQKETQFLPETVSFRQRLYSYLYDLAEIPKCSICNNNLGFGAQLSDGYRKTCSRSCNGKKVLNTPEVRKRNEESKRNSGIYQRIQALAHTPEVEARRLATRIARGDLKQIGAIANAASHSVDARRQRAKTLRFADKKFGKVGSSEELIYQFLLSNRIIEKYDREVGVVISKGVEFVIDILIKHLNLAIEIDGEGHVDVHDVRKDKALRRQGFNVLRIPLKGNEETQIEDFKDALDNYVTQRLQRSKNWTNYRDLLRLRHALRF